MYEGGKSDYASFETLPLAHTDNHMWHHLVMTTKGHGKGMNMFIDGKLEATMPRGLDCENEVAGCVGLLKYSTIDGVRRPYSDPAYFFNAAGAGGDPIDPVGDIRLCGRQIGGAITNSLSHTGDEDFAQFDPRRYFRGQVAHFALWDSPLSQHQVNALLEEYQHLYLMKSSATYGGTPPSAETWQDTANLAGASLSIRYIGFHALSLGALFSFPLPTRCALRAVQVGRLLVAIQPSRRRLATSTTTTARLSERQTCRVASTSRASTA